MKMKKILALTLSATMVMGISMPVMAEDPTLDVTAPIYSFEVLDVVVPATYEVAFNPEGLTVKTGASATSTDQILSRNYGMINKGNKDQVLTVSLTVADQNTGDNKVTFVDSAAEVTNAKDGEYKIHLQAIPADTSEVKVGDPAAVADKDTANADLSNVTMTKAADTAAVTLKSGENEIAFKLDKATYNPKSGSEVTLGATGSNTVKDNFELASLAASGKGITAFTFGGSMNANANWTKLTSGIKITAVYKNEVAPSGTSIINGTGAMTKVGPKVSADANGLITITGLTADKNWESMTITNENGTFDINSGGVEWNNTQWSETAGGSLTVQLGEDWLSTLRGKSGSTTVTLTDKSTISATLAIPAPTEP